MLDLGETVGVSMVSAGIGTVELGIQGVSKATVLDYIYHTLYEEAAPTFFTDILPHYRPGDLIDAQESRTVLATDGDGTLWGVPATGQDLCANHFGNSEAHQAVLQYLRAGGVLLIISGNDPARTIRRFMTGITDEDAVLLNNVIISASGGHTLMVARPSSENPTLADSFQDVPKYREEALRMQKQNWVFPAGTDITFFGDDFKQTGNDRPGFDKVGAAKAFCVHEEKFPAEKLRSDKAIAQILRDNPEILIPFHGPNVLKHVIDVLLALRSAEAPDLNLRGSSGVNAKAMPFFASATEAREKVRGQFETEQ
jgi:hypothetical protein